ncbi:Hypothetical predicted protein [Olea europaea subsp. europaea]|uniref:Uncharacterized protein n=1 Tax=Olea europaea subsp. europaea TaxID=158383 RepID=A0A8S0PGF2_OLEEU|nr:Hypothetical predicted protein [Olea europaea subsp. europaea]
MGHLKQLCSIPVRRDSDSTCALSTGNPTPLSLLQIVICPFQIQGSWFDCEWYSFYIRIAKLWWLSLNVSLKDFLFLDYGCNPNCNSSTQPAKLNRKYVNKQSATLLCRDPQIQLKNPNPDQIAKMIGFERFLEDLGSDT